MAWSRAASMSIGHVLKLIKADNMVVVLQQLGIYEIFKSSSFRTCQKLSILNQIFKSKGCSILWMQCLLIFGIGLSGNLSKFTFNQFEEIFSNKFEEMFLLLLIITTFLTPRHNFNTNSAMQIASPSFLHDFCQFSFQICAIKMSVESETVHLLADQVMCCVLKSIIYHCVVSWIYPKENPSLYRCW